MRVIAGELGGRRLAVPRGRSTRPTAERVREALFSMLGPLEGAVVLDLFAGSGALGIEALSRGAARATFVEHAPAALAALRANVAALGLGERTRVHGGDALAALRREDKYDLVFLDPPYAVAPALAGALSRELPGVLRPGARVVSESDRRAPLQLALTLARERRYGDTLIRIHDATPTDATPTDTTTPTDATTPTDPTARP
jgi:16S rRNA (guanine966-N2)-methyltransferase